jgi:Ala-tRNA(Pro) deacylase
LHEFLSNQKERTMNIKQFLDSKKISYRVYTHPETFDAQHLAAALHVPGANVAKAVLLCCNGGYVYYVAVLQATEHIDLQRVSKCLDGAHVRLATEDEMAQRCPDCECGILPPFGSQLAARTIVDESLVKHDDLFFQGSNHCEAIRLSYHDFENLEHPLVTSIIAKHADAQLPEGAGRSVRM